jgi:hypothetical protein
VEYIRSISDYISAAATTKPNYERLLTVIYHGNASGTVVKRAMLVAMDTHELSSQPPPYSLRWLDPAWLAMESMIADLHITNNLIPRGSEVANLVDPYEPGIPMTCALLEGPDPHPLDFTPGIKEEPPKLHSRKPSIADQVAQRQQGIDLRLDSLEIVKAQVHARRANRNKLFVLFRKPVNAARSLWLVFPLCAICRNEMGLLTNILGKR